MAFAIYTSVFGGVEKLYFYNRFVKLPGRGVWGWPCGAVAGVWGGVGVARGLGVRGGSCKNSGREFYKPGGQNDGFGCKYNIFSYLGNANFGSTRQKKKHYEDRVKYSVYEPDAILVPVSDW